MSIGAQREVVAELAGQLMRIGRAADPRQHRHVANGSPLRLTHTQPLPQPQSDPALTQHMLLRQPEAEVGRQRPGRDSSARRKRIDAQTNPDPPIHPAARLQTSRTRPTRTTRCSW